MHPPATLREHVKRTMLAATAVMLLAWLLTFRVWCYARASSSLEAEIHLGELVVRRSEAADASDPTRLLIGSDWPLAAHVDWRPRVLRSSAAGWRLTIPLWIPVACLGAGTAALWYGKRVTRVRWTLPSLASIRRIRWRPRLKWVLLGATGVMCFAWMLSFQRWLYVKPGGYYEFHARFGDFVVERAAVSSPSAPQWVRVTAEREVPPLGKWLPRVTRPGGPPGWHLSFPMWIPLAGMSAATGAAWWLDRATRRRCRACGYSLAGLPSFAACPECGYVRRAGEA